MTQSLCTPVQTAICCGRTWEILDPIGDGPIPKCKTCGQEPTVIFNGEY